MSQAESVDRLIAGELQAHFACATIGRQIVVLEQTASTNDAILQVVTANSNAGLVLFAEHQTAGRGRRGNRWESAAGKGLWFSILLRPGIQVNDSGRLTIWAMESICDIIRTQFALEPAIKLPNDVLLCGRKVAGVLVEMRAQQKAPHVAIVGIGINVNHSVEDFPPELQNRAISLAMALHRPVDRQQLAVAILRNLNRTYREKFVTEVGTLQGQKS
ncbi:MAG: biotin--[acetyl-CoA-carboxylase] ligase [Verrucomicrobia bacterium]|nr:MAG: biotin--[acetyl-CoA-carboxylase] ligase [Verrucomicrobiota bacterium]PYJ44455.1 MAG: biotin--[acetyl-CoA-carboxylase] ligase [Verrucomicrobiota bacterium]PYL52489.1 MAG: biotin--[acetyl-CoA-carboxylase] ligase [Verrucomicrobiota bacterium]